MAEGDTFERLTASELYCPRCRRSTPVREHLLLVLPGVGQKHDLRCAVCGEPVGTRTEEGDFDPSSSLIVR